MRGLNNDKTNNNIDIKNKGEKTMTTAAFIFGISVIVFLIGDSPKMMKHYQQSLNSQALKRLRKNNGE